MFRRPPRSTLFPYTDALPIWHRGREREPPIGNGAEAGRRHQEPLREDDRDREYRRRGAAGVRSEEHTSELQSRRDLVCRLLLDKKKTSCVSCTICRTYAGRTC